MGGMLELLSGTLGKGLDVMVKEKDESPEEVYRRAMAQTYRVKLAERRVLNDKIAASGLLVDGRGLG